MSDSASGGSGPMNKAIDKKGGPDEGYNKNRNYHRPDWSGNRYSTETFKGKVEYLSTLGLK